MKTIGIIGGMGPMATVDLYGKIVRLTAAARDQEHIPVLVDGNTAIPDRTAAILNGGPDPLPEMLRSAKRLEQAGASVLLIACNTAHYFYRELADQVSVPILHMPRETAAEAKRRGYHTVALLATNGTVQTGIYDDAFSGTGVSLIKPDPEGQRAVMSLIYDGVKAGAAAFDTAVVQGALNRLRRQGAQAFVLGCTELPLAFASYHLEGEPIDPTLVLARSAIRFAGAACALDAESIPVLNSGV